MNQINSEYRHFSRSDLLIIRQYYIYILYITKIENKITSKVKRGYYLDLLTPETMKLLGNTENMITNVKNGKN